MSELKEIVFNNTGDKAVYISELKLDGVGVLTIQFGKPDEPCIAVSKHSKEPFGKVIIEEDTFEWPKKL